MSQDEKSRSRQRIVAHASRLFRERGLAGASVADIMRHAGMTHGGFYRHFKDKDDLVVEALQAAFDEFSGRLASEVAQGDPIAAASDFKSRYLSADHMLHPEQGCPVPALACEIARDGGVPKNRFGGWIGQVTSLLSRGRDGLAAEQGRDRAIREFAMMVGAVVIARASDSETAADVLRACRSED
jgi:TetR/AcrR family transcriptional repressor of nem operon